ncbi:MAG: 3-isopropylmalate dehydratase [Candidatus Bipolaricaulota bacterium]|nr:3-isopropylmalate dehydratase [Candidatus Bipolaricaulota bacterium]
MSIGTIWRYGDDINTDVIFPGKYTYQPLTPEEMAGHAMEDLDPSFAGQVKEGDVIVAGENFGCGSSREQAATCLKAAGIAAVVAKSFSRIFFRNAINNGLPVIELSEGIEAMKKGNTLSVDFEEGVVAYEGHEYHFPALPNEVIAIIEDGGLISHVRKELGKG